MAGFYTAALSKTPALHWPGLSPPCTVIRFLRDPDYIEGIRRDGYATRLYNQFTRNPGKTSSIAVPILVDGAPIGTLTIAFFATAMRMSEAIERFVVPLQECAAAVAFDLRSNP